MPQPMTKEHIGAGLRKLRLMHDMKQSALDANLSVSYISEIENGKKEAPYSFLCYLAQLYNLEMSEFVYFLKHYKSPPTKLLGSPRLRALLNVQRYMVTGKES